MPFMALGIVDWLAYMTIYKVSKAGRTHSAFVLY